MITDKTDDDIQEQWCSSTKQKRTKHNEQK